MALIKITVAGVVPIVFNDLYASFYRGASDTKTTFLNYSNGTGQTLTAGQVLYTSGTVGTDDYLEVSVTNNTTILGDDFFEVNITNQPSEISIDNTVNFTYNGNPITLHLNYESAPVIENIELLIDNRFTKQFQPSEFESHFSDFDGDNIGYVMIEGDVTGYFFDSDPYIASSWIEIQDVMLLEYVASDDDEYYEKINTWKAKDLNGNISVN